MVDAGLKIHGTKNSMNLHKCLVAAKLGNVKVDIVYYDNGNAIMPPKEVANSPTNTVPYLETPEGNISESSAVLLYIGAKGGLAGSNDFERAQIAQWQHFCNQEIAGLKRNTVYPIFGFMPFDDKANKDSLEKLKTLLKGVDSHLAKRQYLVGDKISVADIEFFNAIKHLWQVAYVEQVRKNLFSNVDAYFRRLADHEAFVSVFGKTHCCKVAIKPPRVEKPKEEKKPEPKKEEVKEVKEEKKKEEFPHSDFDFDAWKKQYSNTDKAVAVKELLDTKYDDKAFSVYFIKYQRLEDEGKELWLTENNRDMFLQRIDQYRKYTFGTYGIYGKEGDYDIQGVWMWRGKGIPFFLQEQDAFEYFDKVELDPKKPADRKRIEEYWLNINKGQTVEGRDVCTVEQFK